MKKNYLFDLYLKFPKDFNLETRKDPDLESKKLYEDLFEKLFVERCKNNNKIYKTLPNGNVIKIKEGQNEVSKKQGKWGIEFQIWNNEEFVSTIRLGADYIGPSVNWAKQTGMEDSKIIEFLKVSRTIGGHTLFPRWWSMGNNRASWSDYPNDSISLNFARAGEKGYFDRIDLTLFAIKKFYEEKEENRTSKLFDYLNMNSIWFEQFVNFEEYIRFFKMFHFYDDEGNIFDLTRYDSKKHHYEIVENDVAKIPESICGYIEYVEGTNRLIQLRTNELDRKSITSNVLEYPEMEKPDIIIPPVYKEYRYVVGRSSENPLVVICMNPSSAYEVKSDRTINKIINSYPSLDNDGWIIFNLYPERATNASNLNSLNREYLINNLFHLKQYIIGNNITEVWGAWGDGELKHDGLSEGKQEVINLLSKLGVKVFYFGTLTNQGNPRHPLQRQEKQNINNNYKKYL